MCDPDEATKKDWPSTKPSSPSERAALLLPEGALRGPIWRGVTLGAAVGKHQLCLLCDGARRWRTG